MPSGNPPVIRKPKRRFPLPENIRDLDRPWSDVESARHIRIDHIFKHGFRTGDDPRIIRAPRSPSKILPKL